jgi:hypothetical protein
MAKVIEVVRTRDWAGLRNRRVFDVQGPGPSSDGSTGYVTGGDPVAANVLFLGLAESVPSAIALDTAGAGANPRLVVFDHNNLVMKWFVPNTGNEVANATDLSGYRFRLEVAGKG